MTYIVDNRGTQCWHNSRGQRHRTDGPAWIGVDGTQFWYRNGQFHRTDGLPAVIRADGNQEWWVDGVKTAATHLVNDTSTT